MSITHLLACVLSGDEAECPSLELAKQHLRVRHDDEDDLIASYMAAASAWIVRYTGDNYDSAAPELLQAQLLLIGFYYENRGIGEDVPPAVKALAGPFRLPTVR